MTAVEQLAEAARLVRAAGRSRDAHGTGVALSAVGIAQQIDHERRYLERQVAYRAEQATQ